MTSYCGVHGTWGWPATSGDWWQADSPLSWFLMRHGLAPMRPKDLFSWSGDVDGWLRWPFGANRSHCDWQAGGKALRWYLRDGRSRRNYVRVTDRRVIAHSHGLQVVLYACSEGLRVDRLLSVTGPIRDDMAEIAARARPNIRRWVHVHTDAKDRMQVYGAMFDGVWGIHRKAIWGSVHADEHIEIPGIRHSGLLNDPALFHWWADAGLLPFLTEAPPCPNPTRLRPTPCPA